MPEARSVPPLARTDVQHETQPVEAPQPAWPFWRVLAAATVVVVIGVGALSVWVLLGAALPLR